MAIIIEDKSSFERYIHEVNVKARHHAKHIRHIIDVIAKIAYPLATNLKVHEPMAERYEFGNMIKFDLIDGRKFSITHRNKFLTVRINDEIVAQWDNSTSPHEIEKLFAI